MMNRLCYAILLLLLLTSPIAAQDDTATPFPVLDEAAIFADGVTVIERLPIIYLENGIVHFYSPDTAQWEIYDNPTGIERFSYYRERGDGTYILVSRTTNAAQLPYLGDKDVWIFSPQNRSYEPVEAVCNLIKALPNEGRWYITKIEDNFHLCHNETGQVSRSLDTLNGIDARIGDCLLNEGVQSSSDGKWLVFHNCYEHQHYFGAEAFFVYAYNVETDEITHLGLTDYAQDSYVFEWLDDTALYIASSGGFDGNDRYIFLGNTPEFVRTEKTFYEIDFADDSPVMQRSISINAARIFYRDKTLMWIEQDTQPHPIYLYDFMTQEQQLIATLEACDAGECYIRWHDENTLGIVGAAYEAPRVVPLYIYDKHTTEWVYENAYTDVLRVQDDALLMYSYDSENRQTSLQSLDLHMLTTTIYGTVSNGMLSPNPYPSPDNHYILVSQWNGEILTGVYDIEKNTVYPVLRNDANPITYYQFAWQEDNTLIVAYYQDNYVDVKARWHIRIDALDEEQS